MNTQNEHPLELDTKRLNETITDNEPTDKANNWLPVEGKLHSTPLPSYTKCSFTDSLEGLEHFIEQTISRCSDESSRKEMLSIFTSWQSNKEDTQASNQLVYIMALLYRLDTLKGLTFLEDNKNLISELYPKHSTNV